MKHAILIIAHENFAQLKHLIESFNCDCYVFVHIDKRAKIAKDELSQIKTLSQVVKIYRKYSVHWGGFSILKCQNFLLKESLKCCDASYFYNIIGCINNKLKNTAQIVIQGPFYQQFHHEYRFSDCRILLLWQ